MLIHQRCSILGSSSSWVSRQRAELITPVCPRITIGSQTAGSWKCQASRPPRQRREDCSRSELFGEPSSTWDDLCELVSAWTCSCGWLLYYCQPLQVQGHRLSQPLLHLSPYRRRLGVAVVSSPLGSVAGTCTCTRVQIQSTCTRTCTWRVSTCTCMPVVLVLVLVLATLSSKY